jgi:preprotein translocase SecF subunit
VFNLVKHRKLFVFFSLVIIVPGFISLLFWGLNVGIDFTKGSEVEFRPQRAVTEEQVHNAIKSYNLTDLQIVFGENKGLDNTKMAWIDFNTALDQNVQDDVKTKLQKQFGTTLTINWVTLTDKSKHAFSQLSVSGFPTAMKSDKEIRDTLKDLPKTSDPSKGAPSATPTPVATTGATPSATAGATPSATAQATATPGATATATTGATATATTAATTNNPANTTVEIKTVAFGQTVQTFQILTRDTVSTTANNSTGGNKGDILTSQLQSAFLQAGGPALYIIGNNSVGAAVAADTVRNSIFAVLAASVCILLYIWFSFRKVAHAIRYGVSAIVALLHDVLVVLGVFSILGHFFNVQIDALFITGLLTVIGFSVHDTIVVFDRVRENMQRRSTETFEGVVNASLLQTMARSLNTSLTVLFTLLALTLFTGIGTSIHTFTLTLLIGIASGTYSSIFNASMMLVIWDKGEWFFKYLGEGGHDRERSRQQLREQTREREIAKSRG